MLKKIFFLIAALVACNTYSQEYKKTEIPGVTLADLKQTRSTIDSTASAEYMCRYGHTYYELSNNYWVMVTEVFTRIKIYTKEGYDYANPILRFYSGDGVKAKFVSGNTYNIEDGKMVKTPLKDENAFEQVLDEDYKQKTASLPNVKEGSVLEYTTSITTPYFGHVEDWYFQYDIPARFVQYDLNIPIYFIYNVYTVGYLDIDKPKPFNRMNNKTEVSEYCYRYTVRNVAPFKEEPYISNKANFIAKLEHELSIVQMPRLGVKQHATDWETVARKIYGREEFGRELKQDNYFKDDLKALMGGLQDDDARINAVFNYVQGRMTWDGYRGYLCEKGVKDAYKEKSGNVADINLMLTAMLREAGLDASPVLVSTRQHGVAMYASNYAYDYVVCAVKKGNDVVLLDATSKYTTPGMLPTRALNWKGRLIKKNGDNEEIDLMTKNLSKETISLLCTVAADGSVTGKARDLYQGQGAYTYRESYGELSKESYLEKIEKEYPGLEVSDYEVTNQNDCLKPLIEEYNFLNNRVCEVIGDKIYFNPMLYFADAESPFKSETRQYPVDFIYPRETRYSINITIPDGYKVASLPESLNIGMEQNIGAFRYNLGQTGNVIQVSVIFTINYSSIGSDYYSALREFYQKIIEKQNEKIVLEKA